MSVRIGDFTAIAGFIRARLDEDESWARAASLPYRYADKGATAPNDGVHWQWVAGEQWEPVALNPVMSEFVAEPGEPCHLVSVETWPVTTRVNERVISVRQQARPYDHEIVEMELSAAGHIVRHDPASVLRRITVDREMVERLVSLGAAEMGGQIVAQAGILLRLMASRWNQHPHFQSHWG